MKARVALIRNPSSGSAGDDGLLDITIVSAQTAGDFLAAGFELVRSALAGEEAQDHRVVALRARSIRVVCEPAQDIRLDGEDAGTTPQTFTVLPRDLVVIAR